MQKPNNRRGLLDKKPTNYLDQEFGDRIKKLLLHSRNEAITKALINSLASARNAEQDLAYANTMNTNNAIK